MANKHMKSCSTLLTMREMQTKTAMTNHSTSIRMATILKTVTTPNAGENVEKLDHSFLAGGNVK